MTEAIPPLSKLEMQYYLADLTTQINLSALTVDLSLLDSGYSFLFFQYILDVSLPQICLLADRIGHTILRRNTQTQMNMIRYSISFY